MICFMTLVDIATLASAGDDRSNPPRVIKRVMPPLGYGEFGTDTDNENNAGTGTPDGDMDVYIFGGDSNEPVEFNINIPVANPGRYLATLRMDVYDIDTPDEVDKVYVNGTFLGTLNGADSTWGVNVFNIPFNVLRTGNNLVKIEVDVNRGGWATTIDYAIIQLQSVLAITRAWIAPVSVKAGTPINVFAEITGTATRAGVFYGNDLLFLLSDPDGDGTWSGSMEIPANLPPGFYGDLRVLATDESTVVEWPGVSIY